MYFVAKRKEDDCATCAVAMATGHPYKKVRKVLYKGHMRKPKGGVSRKLIEKCISEFGFEVLKTKDCEFSNLSYLLKGCEAVIILEWKEHDFTHAVFWNGRYILDSCIPGKKIDFHSYNKYINGVNIVRLKTPFYKKAINITYSIVKGTKDAMVDSFKDMKKDVKAVFSFLSFIPS